MGIKNAVVTCASPRDLSKVFCGYFDKILVDAPCSGEGMFKKEVNAIPEWSLANVAKCATRQREILDCAKVMLKDGGRIVYSTCTFSPEEDELQIDGFIEANENFSLISQHKLYPHQVKGEGHFAALMQKNGGEDRELKLLTAEVKDKKRLMAYKQFENQSLKITFDNLHLIGDNLYSLPHGMPKIPLQTLRAGVHLGEFKGERFVPSHSLAMALKAGEATLCLPVDENYSVYLSGNVFPCDQNVSGWALATYKNYPLGWCKAVSGTAKNHFPKGLRVQ
jgi:NOL1/NOP2/fmu family ribosome biogenesis protein